MLGTAGTWIVVLGLAGAEPASGSAREVLQQERCQLELPLAGARLPAEAPIRLPGARRAEGGRPISVSLPSSLLSALVVAILVAAALAVLLHRLPATDPLPLPEPAPKAARQGKAARAPLAHAAADLDAERLAREGRFVEAIHALLLRALAHTGAAAARPALTSRELLREARLGQDARTGLEALVRAVEWAHFGGRPAGAAEYEASLAEYRRLCGAGPKQP